MITFLKSLWTQDADRLVIVENEDDLGYRAVRVPYVPDTADELLGLIGDR